MKIKIRLHELIPDAFSRGAIVHIVEKTGIDRHRIGQYLHNKRDTMSLDDVAQFCEYLIKYVGINPRKLPGALFGRASASLLELIASHPYLEIVIGERRDVAGTEHLWVSSDDISLNRVLLEAVTGAAASACGRKRPEIKPVTVRSPTLAPLGVVQAEAQRTYDEFEQRETAKALVCIGSQKINPLSEVVWARVLGAQPFVAGNEGALGRRVPVFFWYRDGDPKPPSCAGGSSLADVPHGVPGIHYEDHHGAWQCCPCTLAEDAALVLYAHRPSHRRPRLMMVLAGFSGRATRALSKYVAKLDEQPLARQFAEPCFEQRGLVIGMYVVRFRFAARSPEDPTTSDKAEVIDTEIIAISSQAIEKRLRAPAPAPRRPAAAAGAAPAR
ncbi:MAG: hypothetical protein U1E76_06735 [Planctomycetota bacterium]